ncbi:MAG: RHS repeat-associated core domain-containing protein, partial [Acidobacteriota bacterium]
TGYERDIESDLDFAQARYYSSKLGRFYSVDPENAGASADNPQTWNAYAYVGNNPINITDPDGLSWYFNSAQDRYKWFGDNDTVEDGFTSVVGTRGNDDQGRGSFVYEREGGGWVRLNPYTNSFSTFDNRDAATSDFSSVYQCNCQGLVNTIADESVRKGTTVALAAGTAVVIGTGAGVVMAATGTAAGAGITTLGLTGTGTATTAATTTAASTATTATIHGARQLAVRGFTQAEVAATRTGTQMLQRDGARVFLKEVAPGKFNVLVQGERGVVTALKNISWKSVTRLAQNYGWNSPIK